MSARCQGKNNWGAPFARQCAIHGRLTRPFVRLPGGPGAKTMNKVLEKHMSLRFCLPASKKLLLVVGALFVAPQYGFSADTGPANPDDTATVEVVGAAPLPVVGVAARQVPANVQTISGKEIHPQQPQDVGHLLAQNLGSVNVNDAQENPFQPDVNYRGFTASPLLGTPQGLSVYVDGVRVNEAFGDVVNWDLIPPSAISSIDLVPGSNPVFGLNTLGGALSVQTKSGFDNPGFAVQTSGGSFGRLGETFEWGGHGRKWDYFLTGNHLSEQGWRDHSGSQVKQLFGKVGYQDSQSHFELSYTGADNDLHGTQALPLSMLYHPAQAYTWPDYTRNRLEFMNVKGSHFLRDDLLLSGNLYYRGLRSQGFNSNTNNDFDRTQAAGPGNPQGSNILGNTDQRSSGGGLQLSSFRDIAGHHNKLMAGATADLGNTNFNQYGQDAMFTPDRETVGSSPFALQTRVNARNRYYGLYASDLFSLNRKWELTLAGRYNYAHVKLTDQLGTALNGEHSFSRFNPAVGLNFHPNAALDAYVSYNEGMRVPTPVELTCADPNAPCSLPNDFISDPALKPVIAKTWETGVRGKLGKTIQWNAALFRTNLDDDIQFISQNGAQGFFQNIPQSRRQGLELGLHQHLHKLTLAANYSFIDATYRAPFSEMSGSNSMADSSGLIHVNPGDRIPGVPQQIFKLRATYDFTPHFSAGANLYLASAQYARGDENNQDRHGQAPGYGIVGLDANYHLNRNWALFANADNLFNKPYQTLGLLGTNYFTGPGNTYDVSNPPNEQFRSPGAPRSIFVGIRYTADKPKAL
jgi:iron complex outermembrane recepter protein